MPGRLMLCPTPLGNLEDVTLRVLRALREADVIFAEDTRVSQTLLRYYDIHKPLRSFHERVESRRIRELARLLGDDKTIAVVTDAGMPGISDPGIELVRAARERNAAIEVLPGPSALLGALVLSGFDVSRFRFDGFPPRNTAALRKYLATLSEERSVLIWYESPARVRALLAELAAAYPERRVFALREYTKKFEEHVIGTAAAVRAALPEPRGEFVIVLDAATETTASQEIPEHVVDAMQLLIRSGVRPRLAVDALVTATGIRKNVLYSLSQSIAGSSGGRSFDARDRK